MADERATSFLKDGNKLLAIPVMYRGWECDDTAWVIEHEGEIALVVTNHSGAYFADKSFLQEKIEEYTLAITVSRQALGLLASI